MGHDAQVVGVFAAMGIALVVGIVVMIAVRIPEMFKDKSRFNTTDDWTPAPEYQRKTPSGVCGSHRDSPRRPHPTPPPHGPRRRRRQRPPRLRSGCPVRPFALQPQHAQHLGRQALPLDGLGKVAAR